MRREPFMACGGRGHSFWRGRERSATAPLHASRFTGADPLGEVQSSPANRVVRASPGPGLNYQTTVCVVFQTPTPIFPLVCESPVGLSPRSRSARQCAYPWGP